MDVWSALGIGLAFAFVPAGKRFVTSPLRRAVKNRLPNGTFKRILLMPLGYTKKARDEAAMLADIEDYRLSAQKLAKGDVTEIKRLSAQSQRPSSH